MIKLSKAEAQRIQAEHIEWYGRTYEIGAACARLAPWRPIKVIQNTSSQMASMTSSSSDRVEHRGRVRLQLEPYLLDSAKSTGTRGGASCASISARAVPSPEIDCGSCSGSLATPQSYENDGATALDFSAGRR